MTIRIRKISLVVPGKYFRGRDIEWCAGGGLS